MHAFALPAPVTLDQAETVKDQLGGVSITRQGNLSQLGSAKVEITKGKQVAITEISNRMFQDFQEASSELISNHKKFGLKTRPTSNNLFLETADRFVIARSISFTVEDFTKAVGSKFLEEFAVTENTGTATPTLNQAEQAEFDAYKAEVQGRSADDPLRKALESDGENGLMKAIFQGLGGITIEEVRTVFKAPVAVKNGKAQFPGLKKNAPAREVDRKHTTQIEAMKNAMKKNPAGEGKTGNHTDTIQEHA